MPPAAGRPGRAAAGPAEGRLALTPGIADVTDGQITTRVTRSRLADGRELLYFDRDATSPRSAADLRDLPARGVPSELRWDPMQQEWTVIAGHRQARTFRPAAADCPLCPSRGTSRTEIPEPGYEVVAFENRFPAFAPAPAGPAPVTGPIGRREPGLPRSRPGYGRCEVMVFTDDHAASFSALPASRVGTIIDAWAHRSSELISRPDVAYVYCFENRGDEIGVTIAHPAGPAGIGWHLSASIFTIRRSAGRLKYLAGSESGAAVWISDVAPEAAAAALRGDRR
jgi:UDPglucose--hexose-1-phosphate uridylyltransferase